MRPVRTTPYMVSEAFLMNALREPKETCPLDPMTREALIEQRTDTRSRKKTPKKTDSVVAREQLSILNLSQ